MSKKYNLEEISKKLQKHEIPKECEKQLPFIVDQYFKGKSREFLKFDLRKKCKPFIDLIYNSIEDMVKTDSLDKIRGVFIVGHLNNYKDDPLFADAIIRYCIEFKNLKKEVFKIFSSLDKETKNILYRRYKNGKGKTTDREALKTLAQTSEFRGLLKEI